MPCAGSFPRKTLTRAIIWKQPSSLSAQAMGGILWMATDGLYWQAPTGVPAACDWQYLAVCTGNSAAPHIIPTIQSPHLRSHQPLSESFPTHLSSISTIASESQLLVSIAQLSIGLFLFFFLIYKHSFHINGICFFFPPLLKLFFPSICLLTF